MKLLGFVAIYGLILAPFVAIIVFEYFFYKKAGIIKNYAGQANLSFYKSVFWAWTIRFGILFLVFSKAFQNK